MISDRHLNRRANPGFTVMAHITLRARTKPALASVCETFSPDPETTPPASTTVPAGTPKALRKNAQCDQSRAGVAFSGTFAPVRVWPGNSPAAAEAPER